VQVLWPDIQGCEADVNATAELLKQIRPVAQLLGRRADVERSSAQFGNWRVCGSRELAGSLARSASHVHCMPNGLGGLAVFAHFIVSVPVATTLRR
jgi:hypothetical protein